MAMTRSARGIQSQFWNIKDPEPQEFNLEIKIVDKFPEKISKHAAHLTCWAFKANQNGKAVLVGFPEIGGEIEDQINVCYAIVNKSGTPIEMLFHNYMNSYTVKLEESASSYNFMLQILKCEGQQYFDSNCIVDLIRNKAE